MKRAIGKIVVLAAVLFVIASFVQKLTEAEAQEKKTVRWFSSATPGPALFLFVSP